MDIKAALLEEHSKAQCSKIVKYIGRNKDRFAELMKLFFRGEYRVTQRAAWPMSCCVRKYPELIQPYFKPLLDKLETPGLHNAIPRNILRLLQDVQIPEKYHGRIMTICFDFVQSNEAAVAVRAFSLGVLQNLAKTYPEILPELKTIAAERWEHETAAVRSRAKKILKPAAPSAGGKRP